MATLEEVLSSTKQFFIGVDEVGNGALAGPVVIGAVRAPRDWTLEGLNDSKKLSEKKRDALRVKLLEELEKGIISYHLAERSNLEIDTLGITGAMNEAYVESFNKLYQPDSLIIMDGIFKFDNLGVDAYDKTWLVKADAHIPAVMAASVLAKTYRDGLMKEWHKQYPAYDWISNMGYGAKAHKDGIATYGPCAIHRFCYSPMKDMPKPVALWSGVTDVK